MLKKKTVDSLRNEQDYIKFITYLELNEKTVLKKKQKLTCDMAQSLNKGSSLQFIDHVKVAIKSDNKLQSIFFADIIIYQTIADAMQSELDCNLPTFIWNVEDVQAFLDKYNRLNLMLRRIELDLPDQQEAYQFIDDQKISPFSVQAVIYSMISILGHRQEILMKIASWYLDRGCLMQAYMFLSVVQNPTEDVLEMKEQLGQILQQKADSHDQ